MCEPFVRIPKLGDVFGNSLDAEDARIATFPGVEGQLAPAPPPVVMPQTTPQIKVDAVRSMGATVLEEPHDVTDDFFLNPIWRDRVLGSRLGEAIWISVALWRVSG